MEVHLKGMFSDNHDRSNSSNDVRMMEKNVIQTCQEVKHTFSILKSRFKHLNHSGEGFQWNTVKYDLHIGE